MSPTATCRQIARAADELGYFGVLLPTGQSCEDSWVIASSLVPLTERLRFLVAVRPGLQEPSVAARMTATLDRISNGRLLINVVTGGDPVEARGDGIFMPHDDRYAVTDEFLAIYRRLLVAWRPSRSRASTCGSRTAGSCSRPCRSPIPPLYFGGSSEAGMRVAGDHVDTYLTWGEPPADVAKKIADAKRAARRARGAASPTASGSTSSCGRPRKEAWAAADDLIRYVDDAAVAKAQAVFARYDSVGQRRMAELHGGRRDKLEIAPNLWAGVGLVRGGAGTALVGNPDEVAARMREYMELGIDRFILSGYPHLEECYRFAELVFPKLPLHATTGIDRGTARNAGPFGEMVANTLPAGEIRTVPAQGRVAAG